MDYTVETMSKTVETMGKKINSDQMVIEKLAREIAQLKRLNFAKRSEKMNPEQASLLNNLIDTDAGLLPHNWLSADETISSVANQFGSRHG